MPAPPQSKGKVSWLVHLMADLVPFLVAGLFFYLGHLTAAVVVTVLAVIIVAGAHLSAAFRRGVDRVGLKAAQAIGGILRAVLLLPFYLLIMAPIAVVRRLAGADPLKLTLDAEAKSYWQDHGPMTNRYDRPF